MAICTIIFLKLCAICHLDFSIGLCYNLINEREVIKMTNAEIRKAKAELHKVIIDTVHSFGGTVDDEAKMYIYIIELASNEMLDCIISKEG